MDIYFYFTILLINLTIGLKVQSGRNFFLNANKVACESLKFESENKAFITYYSVWNFVILYYNI